MPTEPTPVQKNRGNPASGRRLRAYIVEDSPVIRDSLIAALEELMPLDVVGTAQEESQALAALIEPPARQPVCDIVIVDLFLRRGSGLGVLAALQRRPDPPERVVLTNHSTAAMRERCLQLGASRVFDKSSEFDALLQHCSALLERGGASGRAG